MVAEPVIESPLRRLRGSDLPDLLELLSEQPVHNLFLEYRVRAVSLDSPWFGGDVWGHYEGNRLVAACHAATNVIPVGRFDDHLLESFALRVRRRPAASIVGDAHVVAALWQLLEPAWGPARSLRMNQPLLAISGDPLVEPDTRVRAVLIDEFDVVYPTCVAMFFEEVGTDPERGNRDGYRARVAQIISQGWSFAIIEDERVLFKAEVGAVTPTACQVQGVYVAPEIRGEGLAAPALAAVVQQARERIAPTVSLYVNDHNIAARRAYARVGFEQVGTLATVLM